MNRKCDCRWRIGTLIFLVFGYVEATYKYSSYSSRCTDSFASVESLGLNVCSDSVVAVSYIGILCDSPYTFYYGNGANRNSKVCDYGDKAALKIKFDVVDDLQGGDTEIFFTMAAYDDAENLLFSTTPESLCTDYVGYDCTKAGSYEFEKKVKFGTPYDGNRRKFYPVIQMAFSTKSNSGYNLGAVNMQCVQWDANEPAVVAWRNESKTVAPEEFVIQYGMLMMTAMSLIVVGIFVLIRSRDNPGFDHLPEYVRDRKNSGEMSMLGL